MKISYNAPFILTYTFFSFALFIVDAFTGSKLIVSFFTVFPDPTLSDPLTPVRILTHIAGHANFAHFLQNFIFILLLGPILEEKYGTKRLFIWVLITAGITGLLNIFLFATGLVGASGVVFMFILLSSLSNLRSGEIPMTFILILILFLGREIYNVFVEDNISQFAHIIGGLCGSFFGFRAKV